MDLREDRDDLRTKIEAAGRDLTRLRDEIGVQLELAGMEAKRIWEALEPHVARTQAGLRDAVKTVAGALHDREPSLELHLALMDARERLREMEPGLRAIARRVREAGTAALPDVPDPVKLKARLASMDLDDAWQRRRHEVERGMREAESFARKLADDILARLEQLRSK